MKDLKEAVKDAREALKEIKNVEKSVDELKAHDVIGAARELNALYCDTLVSQNHNEHIPKLAALGDEIIPVLDEYINIYSAAVNDINRMKSGINQLDQLRRDLLKFQEKHAETQKANAQAAKTVTT